MLQVRLMKFGVGLVAMALTVGYAQAEVKTYRGIRPSDPQGLEGLRNPERGYRFEILVAPAADDTYPGLKNKWPFARFPHDGVTMTQAYCYLTQFYNRPVSKEKIAALQADFDRARKDGVKYLLRFAYEYGNAPCPPPTLDQVLAHIKQLTPVVRKNSDVIYAIQTGWLGFWGELHSSKSGLDRRNPVALAKVVQGTLDMMPPHRFTTIRRLDYKRVVLDLLKDAREITPETAFTPALHARIGFHNDGTLANFTDGGTFIGKPSGPVPGNYDFGRALREGPFMAVDGELFWSPVGERSTYANGTNAVKRLREHCYTTLSMVHSFSELDKRKPWSIDDWKVTPLTRDVVLKQGVSDDPDYFAGVPSRMAFDYIRDHLGYRLQLVSSELTSVPEGTKLTLRLRNVGFAPPINLRHPEIVVVDAKGNCREYPQSFDCRRLSVGPTHELTATIPALKPGERVALWLPDLSPSLRYRADYAIRLANAMTVETVGGRLLHVLEK